MQYSHQSVRYTKRTFPVEAASNNMQEPMRTKPTRGRPDIVAVLVTNLMNYSYLLTLITMMVILSSFSIESQHLCASVCSLSLLTTKKSTYKSRKLLIWCWRVSDKYEYEFSVTLEDYSRTRNKVMAGILST